MVLRRFAVCVALAGVLVFSGSVRAAEPEKPPTEEEVLELMDADLAREVLEVVDQLKTWRTKVEDLRKQLKEAKEAPPAETIVPIVEALVKRSEPFRKVVRFSDTIQQRLKEWQDQALDAQARVLAAKAVVEEELAKVFDLIEKAKDPAGLLKRVAEQELDKLLGQPREVAGVNFKFKRADKSKPLFSRQKSGIVVEIDYGGIAVEATGIFFKPTKGAPGFALELDPEKITITQDPKKLAAQKLLSLGGEILEGCPIGVSDFQFADFGKTKAVQCKIKIDMGDLLPISAAGSVIIDIHGKPHWGDGPLEIDVRPPAPLPLPPTPFAIHEGQGKYWPKEKQVQVGLIFSMVPPGSDQVLALDVSAKFTLPPKSITFSGAVKTLARKQTLGDATVTIDFRKKTIVGSFNIPGKDSTIPAVYALNGEFVLKKEGFFGKGKLKYLRIPAADMTLAIQSNGHIFVTATSDIKAFDAEIGAKMDIHIHPNLRMEAHAVAAVELPADFAGGHKFAELIHDLSVSFVLDMDTASDADELVTVTFSGLGVKGSIKVASLGELTMGRLVKEVKDKLGEMGDSVADKAKDLDITNKNSALRIGLKKLDPTNPSGDLRKRIGNGDLSNPNNDLTRAYNNVIAKPLAKGKKAVTKTIKRWLGKDDDKEEEQKPIPPPTPEQLAAADRGKRLLELADALNEIQIDEEPPAEVHDGGAVRFRRETALHVRLRHAVAGPAGDVDATLAFMIDSSGYAATINTRDPAKSRRIAGGEVIWAAIEFTNLLGTAGPYTAEINVPNLQNDYSDISAKLRVLQAVQLALAKHLPEVLLQGPRIFDRKNLVIDNRCEEPVTVWVQARQWDYSDQVQRWGPGKPGGLALKFAIPARTKVILADRRDLIVEDSSGAKLPQYEIPNFGGSSIGKGIEQGFKQALEQIRKDFVGACTSGSVVRVWAESAGGERWEGYRSQNLFLVDKNPKMAGDRAYLANQIGTYTYALTPSRQPRFFSERVLEFYNDTTDELSVQLRYLATENGVSKWQTLPAFPVKPGEAVQPRRPDGLRVRASQITFSAEGKELLFDAYQGRPLYLVEQVKGSPTLRAYSGTRIGSYQHTFRPKATGPTPPK